MGICLYMTRREYLQTCVLSLGSGALWRADVLAAEHLPNEYTELVTRLNQMKSEAELIAALAKGDDTVSEEFKKNSAGLYMKGKTTIDELVLALTKMFRESALIVDKPTIQRLLSDTESTFDEYVFHAESEGISTTQLSTVTLIAAALTVVGILAIEWYVQNREREIRLSESLVQDLVDSIDETRWRAIDDIHSI